MPPAPTCAFAREMPAVKAVADSATTSRSGSRCSSAKRRMRSTSNPAGAPSGPTNQVAAPGRISTTSSPAWRGGCSADGNGSGKGDRPRQIATTATPTATIASAMAPSQYERRLRGLTQPGDAMGIEGGAWKTIIATPPRPYPRARLALAGGRRNDDNDRSRRIRATAQRRAAPHGMVVNLVRSGRKQPQRFSASAGGSARLPFAAAAAADAKPPAARAAAAPAAR